MGNDCDDLAALVGDPEVWRFDLRVEEADAFLDRQLRLWAECGFGGCAVRDLRDGTFLGIVGLGVPTLQHLLLPSVTIGWRFSSTAWGQGYATEAGAALLHEAFGPMQLDHVGCITNADNHRSVALARRLGMHVVAQEIEPRDHEDGGVVVVILVVDRRTWLALDHGWAAHRTDRSRCHHRPAATLWVLEGNVHARTWYERRGWNLNGDRTATCASAGIDDVGYQLPL